jgi:hypothetical protein
LLRRPGSSTARPASAILTPEARGAPSKHRPQRRPPPRRLSPRARRHPRQLRPARRPPWPRDALAPIRKSGKVTLIMTSRPRTTGATEATPEPARLEDQEDARGEREERDVDRDRWVCAARVSRSA